MGRELGTSGTSGTSGGGNGSSGGTSGGGSSSGSGTGGMGYNGQETYCIKVSSGFDQAVTQQGQIIDLGTFNFTWQGNGQIYITSTCPANPNTDKIWADDELDVIASLGTLSVKNVDHGLGGPYGGCHYAPDLNISSILQTGDNSLDFQIKDTGANLIGCSPLYITLVVGGESPDTDSENIWQVLYAKEP